MIPSNIRRLPKRIQRDHDFLRVVKRNQEIARRLKEGNELQKKKGREGIIERVKVRRIVLPCEILTSPKQIIRLAVFSF